MPPVVEKLQQAVGERGLAAIIGAMLMLVPLLVPYGLLWRSWGILESKVDNNWSALVEARKDMREEVAKLNARIEGNRDALFSQTGIVPLLREMNTVLADVKETQEEMRDTMKTVEQRVGRVEFILPTLKPIDEVKRK